MGTKVRGPLSRYTLLPHLGPHNLLRCCKGIPKLVEAQLQQGLAASQGLVARAHECTGLQVLKDALPCLAACCVHLNVPRQDLNIIGHMLGRADVRCAHAQGGIGEGHLCL